MLALTDGVVAIALTLLVLQLQVPASTMLANDDSARELWHALNIDVGELTSYLVSFVIIAQFWLVHHRAMRDMQGHSEGLAWRNFGFLLALTLMPFTSDLIGRYGSNPVAITLFALNLAFLTLSTQWIMLYAFSHDLVEEKHRSPHDELAAPYPRRLVLVIIGDLHRVRLDRGGRRPLRVAALPRRAASPRRASPDVLERSDRGVKARHDLRTGRSRVRSDTLRRLAVPATAPANCRASRSGGYVAIRAVLFDFGGVITSSPFDAFTQLEEELGLPADFIRTVNATNPDENAWARLERSEVDLDTFAALWSDEARALGHEVDGRAVLERLAGQIRPEMVAAIRTCRATYKTGCLTNNFGSADSEVSAEVAAVYELFDAVLESRTLGVRKPDPRFYELACSALDVRARGVRLPRRPRRQPQTGPGHRHAHHQGHGPRCRPARAGRRCCSCPSTESRRTRAIGIRPDASVQTRRAPPRPCGPRGDRRAGRRTSRPRG